MITLNVLLFFCAQFFVGSDAGGSIEASFYIQGHSMLTGDHQSPSKHSSSRVIMSKKVAGDGSSLRLVKNPNHGKQGIAVAKSAASRQPSPVAVEHDGIALQPAEKHVNGYVSNLETHVIDERQEMPQTLDLPLESQQMDAGESHVNERRESTETEAASREHQQVAQKGEFTTTLGQYLDQVLDHYRTEGKRVPAQTIARVMNRMSNALSFYFLRKDELFHLDQPMTLENFRLDENTTLNMDGTVHMKFHPSDTKLGSLAEVGRKNLALMSPEKIKEMRLETNNKDMAWLFGSVIHLLLYQKYPFDEWKEMKEFDKKCGENDKLEQGCIDELRGKIQNLMEMGHGFPISNEDNNLNKHYHLLSTVMKECLEMDPKKRMPVQHVGSRLLKLAAGLLPWSK